MIVTIGREARREEMEHALTSTARRRGHQHHPRHATRRRVDIASRGPAQCGPAGTTITTDDTADSKTTIPLISTSLSTKTAMPPPLHEVLNFTNVLVSPRRFPNLRKVPETTGSNHEFPDTNLQSTNQQCKLNLEIKDPTPDVKNDVQKRPAQCGQDIKKKESWRKLKNENLKEAPRILEKLNIGGSPEPEHADARVRGDGNSDEEPVNVEEDTELAELAELARLRCPSERTEVEAEREARRRKRCADYPGLAFGSSIFSSDTMMKFSLIKNELANITGNQLKRVSIVLFKGKTQ